MRTLSVRKRRRKISRGTSFKIAKKFGINISRIKFTKIISNLSCIISVSYHDNFIRFKSNYCTLELKRGEPDYYKLKTLYSC